MDDRIKNAIWFSNSKNIMVSTIEVICALTCTALYYRFFFLLPFSHRVWFLPLWTALTMQMSQQQNVRNLEGGINISRRQKIWWVSKKKNLKKLPWWWIHTIMCHVEVCHSHKEARSLHDKFRMLLMSRCRKYIYSERIHLNKYLLLKQPNWLGLPEM